VARGLGGLAVTTTVFRQGKLGGGGHMSGFNFSPDGKTRITHNDTTGAFMWYSPTAADNPVADTNGYWRNLVRTANRPTPRLEDYDQLGPNGWNIYSAVCAPSNPLVIYAGWPGENNSNLGIGRVIKSTDRGATWTVTNFGPLTLGQTLGAFGDRNCKPHMAVDPADEDICYLGRHDGSIWRTFDGGATWAQVSTSEIPLGTTSGDFGPNPIMVFDSSNGLTSGRTNNIFINSGGNGTYKSEDAGVTFDLMTGGPTRPFRYRCDSLGRLYALEIAPADFRCVWHLDGSTWTHHTVIGRDNQNILSLDINPLDEDEIVVSTDAGHIARSVDRAATFGNFSNVVQNRVATDIQWLEDTNEDYLVNIDMRFDPVVARRLWFAGGIGPWYVDLPSDYDGSTQSDFREFARGIDGLILETMLKAPGGSLQFSVEDRDGFRITDPDTYSATQHIPPAFGQAIRHGWGMDWASFPTPHTSVLVRVSSGYCSYSTDDGLTWTNFSRQPVSGAIAASSATSFVMFEGWDGQQYYTEDAGTTWTAVTWKNAALTTLDQSWFNYGFLGFYNCRKPVVADRATADVYYAYKWDFTDTSYAGYYKSTDGGATFIKQAAAHIGVIGSGGNNMKLITVPGHAGHVFQAPGWHNFTSAVPDVGSEIHLFWTDDGWATKEECTDFQVAGAIGIGAAAPGGTYPTIYIAGCRDDTFGVWSCPDWDGARTWTLLTTDATYTGTIDQIRDMAGDLGEYGTIYLAYASTGFGVGQLSSAPGTRTIRLRGI
jgi:hypothetical protein